MSDPLRRLDNWSFWQARTARERRLLAILAAVAIVALFLVAVVRPLQAARGAAQADIRTYQALAARLHATTAAAPARPRRSGDAAVVAAAVAGENGLPVRGAVPADGGVRLSFADVGYDAVLRWAAAVEATSRYRVRRLTILPGAAPGLVAAEAEVG